MIQKTFAFGFLGCVIFILIASFFPAGNLFSATIQWHQYDEGITLGKKENKKVFLFFWAEWCKFCEKMEKETLNEPQIVSYLKENFITVKVNSDTEQSIANKYFVQGLPTAWFVGEQGEKISNLPGYVSSEMFLPILRYIHSDSYKKLSFNEFLDKK